MATYHYEEDHVGILTTRVRLEDRRGRNIKFLPSAHRNCCQCEKTVKDKIDLKSVDPPEMLYGVTGLTDIKGFGFLPDGMLIIGDIEKGLQLYNHSGSPVEHPLNGKCKDEICTLSVSNTAFLVAVTCSNFTIKVFAADGLKWHENTFSADGDMLIAFTINGDIILCERQDLRAPFPKHHGIGKIVKYSISGQEIWTKTLPEKPVDFCVDGQERIIICYKHRITIYDESTEELFSIQRTGNSIIPYSVCVDSQGDIFVADTNTKAVLLFDSEGNYIEQLLQYREPLYKMSLGEDNYLAISVNRHIRVYDIRPRGDNWLLYDRAASWQSESWA